MRMREPLFGHTRTAAHTCGEPLERPCLGSSLGGRESAILAADGALRATYDTSRRLPNAALRRRKHRRRTEALRLAWSDWERRAPEESCQRGYDL
jgi:hypothetical protein